MQHLDEVDKELEELRSNTFDTFCGYKILKEENKEFMWNEHNNHEYVLAIMIDGFKISAKAYTRNTNKGEHFGAIVEEWGVNWHKPDWYKMNFEFDIEKFDDAKSIALEIF